MARITIELDADPTGFSSDPAGFAEYIRDKLCGIYPDAELSVELGGCHLPEVAVYVRASDGDVFQDSKLTNGLRHLLWYDWDNEFHGYSAEQTPSS